MARFIHRSFACVRSLSDDKRGSTLAFLAAAIVPLTAFIGVGVDLGRAYMVSTRLQSAVDAAALAAVRSEQVYPGFGTNAGPRTQQTVNALLAANLTPGFMGITSRSSSVSIRRSGEEITVEVSGSATLPTVVMPMFGITAIPIRNTATAVAGRTLPTAVEAMLVLDNTGSMDANGGMLALRQSVGDFLDIVYGDRETRPNFAIGMLPYSVIVNVGRLLPPTMVEQVPGFTDRAATDPGGWKGCVYADKTRRNLTSDINSIDPNAFDMGKQLPGEDGMGRVNPSIYPPLQVRSFRRQDNRYRFWGTDAEIRAVANYQPMRTALVRQYGTKICRDPAGNATDCTAPGASVDPTLISGYASWPNPRLYRSDVKPIDGDGVVVASPNYVCPSEALPISYAHTKSRLKSYVANENQPLFNIGTWHSQAMTWAYRLLARDDVFRRNRPSDLGLRRVVVFMTDGNFDSNDEGSTVSGRGQGLKDFQRDTAYSGYGSYADRIVIDQEWSPGSSGTAAARAAHRDAMATRFLKTCQAMKREGIEIYTITFAILPGAEANMTRQMFKTCATDPNTHFFETDNAGDLRTAFTTIAAELVDLHLVK